jgi:hypothetical protein
MVPPSVDELHLDTGRDAGEVGLNSGDCESKCIRYADSSKHAVDVEAIEAMVARELALGLLLL